MAAPLTVTSPSPEQGVEAAAPAMLSPTMFSRVASQLHGETNPLYTLRDQLRAQGRRIIDLVSGNVTEHGLVFPPDILERALADGARRCAVYRPDSFGQRPAREALSAYYALQGVSIPPDRFVLTPGTSISYWYSFRLLADEGDEILCPSPSYPLFDYIALLGGVRLIPYRLQEERGWRIDLDHLEACISTRTRALALISPHNPTGHVPGADELEGVAELAARHDLAIISDEVFSEFLLGPGPLPRPALTAAPLVITLNGFSKMYALPGLKLGWMALSGEEVRVGRALAALEMISDTFLPVSEIAQAAVPDIMSLGGPFLEEYSAEIRRRWAEAARILGPSPDLSFVPPRGGFYVTLRLRETGEDEAAEQLLREEGLLVHPGHFYDIAPSHLVISFVQEPAIIRDAYGRIVGNLASRKPGTGSFGY